MTWRAFIVLSDPVLYLRESHQWWLGQETNPLKISVRIKKTRLILYLYMYSYLRSLLVWILTGEIILPPSRASSAREVIDRHRSDFTVRTNITQVTSLKILKCRWLYHYSWNDMICYIGYYFGFCWTFSVYSLLLQFPYDPTYGEKESSPATDKLIQQVNHNLTTS